MRLGVLLLKQLRACVKALKEGGVAVYMPAVHEGVCTSPYCAVQYLGGYPQKSTGYELLRVHIYAPVGQLGMLQSLKDKVENALRPLAESGVLRQCEGIGACTVDDTYKAYASYLDYRVMYGMNQ